MKKSLNLLLVSFLFMIFFVLTSCGKEEVKVKFIIDDAEQEIIVDSNSLWTNDLIPTTDCFVRKAYLDKDFKDEYQGAQISEDITLYIKQHQSKEGWKRDSAQHWHECEGCDEVLDAVAHEYGDWVIDLEVDHANNKDGLRHKDCKVCGFSMKDPIKAMPVFYVRGSFMDCDWGAPDKFKMTIDTDKATATIKGIVFAVGNEWKIATSDWSNEANSGNLDDAAKEYFEGDGNIKCKVAGTYTITVSDLLGAKTISVEKTA